MNTEKLNKSSLTQAQRLLAEKVCDLYSQGMSYLSIAKIVGRSKRSVVRTVKSFDAKKPITKEEYRHRLRTATIARDVKNIKLIGQAILIQYRAEDRVWNKYDSAVLSHVYKKRDKRTWKERYYGNPSFKAKCRARSRVRNFLKTKGKWRNQVGISKWIGCTGKFLKQHLESMFRPGMTWDNHGIVWEIDHIKPLASANLSDLNDIAKHSHYSNLQPLFKKENRDKRDKYIHDSNLQVLCQ